MDASGAGVLLSLAEDANPKLRGPDAKAALEQLDNAHTDLLTALQ